MKKSTAAISLVLIGSALFVAGCSSDDEEEGRNVSHGGGGATYVGRAGVGGRGPAVSGSARGGFGGTGAGAVGG